MTLFIGNIPCDWNEENVRETVKPFDDIKQLQLIKNVIGGWEVASVILTFSNSESVEKAISLLHEQGLTGTLVRKENEIVHRKITVNGLTEQSGYISRLKNIFSQYGRIIEIRAVRWGEIRSGNGSAVILYGSSEQAQHAINAMNGQYMDGYTTPLIVQPTLPFDFCQMVEKKIKRYMKRKQNVIFPEWIIGRKILVGGLSSTVDYDKLRSIFSHYGTIEKVNILWNKDQSVKSAYILYRNAEEAHDAVDAVDDIAVHNSDIICDADDQLLIVEISHQPSSAGEEDTDVTDIPDARKRNIQEPLYQKPFSKHTPTIRDVCSTTHLVKPVSNYIPTIGDIVCSTTQLQRHVSNRIPTIGDVVSSTVQCRKRLSTHSAIGDVVRLGSANQKGVSNHIQGVYSSSVACPTIGDVVRLETSRHAFPNHIQAFYSAVTGQRKY